MEQPATRYDLLTVPADARVAATFSEDAVARMVSTAADGRYSEHQLKHLRNIVRGFDNLVYLEKHRRDAEIRAAVARADAAAKAADEAFQDEQWRMREAEATAVAAELIESDLNELPGPHRTAILRLARISDARYALAVRAIRRRQRPVPASRYDRDADKARRARARIAHAQRLGARVFQQVRIVVDAIEPPPAEVAPWGRRLAIGCESDIAEVAARLAEERHDLFRAHMHMAPHLLAAIPSYERQEQTCPRYWRRKLRRESLRAQAYFDTALRMCGPRRAAVSSYTLGHWEERQKRAAEWALATRVHLSDGQVFEMSDIQASALRSRKARLWAVNKGMERLSERHDFVAAFVTITLPGKYHAFVSGPQARNGSYPRAQSNEDWSPDLGPTAQKDELNRIWQQFRARLAKHDEMRDYFGIAVPEPHKDGTPHLHALLYLPRTIARGERQRSTINVIRRHLKEVALEARDTTDDEHERDTYRQTQVTLVDKDKGGASPASYVMKYILKSLAAGGDADDDDREDVAAGESSPHRAWLAARGMRGMRMLGAHGFNLILQKLWIIKDDEERGPQSGEVAEHLAAVRRWREVAEAAEDDQNRTAAKSEQSDAMADAMLAMGMVRRLRGDVPRLRLAYERGETSYGRPTKRPVAISEPGPDRVLEANPRPTTYEYDEDGQVVGMRCVNRGREVHPGSLRTRRRAIHIPTTIKTHLKPLVEAAYGQLDMTRQAWERIPGETREYVDHDGCIRRVCRRTIRVVPAAGSEGRFEPFDREFESHERLPEGRFEVIPAHRRRAEIVTANGQVTVVAMCPRAGPADRPPDDHDPPDDRLTVGNRGPTGGYQAKLAAYQQTKKAIAGSGRSLAA